MAARKVIITAAQTGAFQGRETISSIPITPREIAESARDCINAGAAIIHVHARDENGNSCNTPRIYNEIGSEVRARCSGVLQYSTAPACIPGATAEDGMQLLYDKELVKPEMCSLDCSLIGTTWKGRTFVYQWSREFILKYLALMQKMRIKPELECFNVETLEDVVHFYLPSGLLDEPLSLSLVMGMERISQGAIGFSEENLDFLISKLPKDKPVSFTTIAIGAKNHVRGLTMSALKGGNIRVGMEDNIYYAPNRFLRSNAEIVERAVRIIRELGMEPASPEEAREMLKLEKP